MNTIIHFEAFLLTGILLNLTPGNDSVFILTKSIAQGKKAGMASVLGITTGNIIHTLLAAFGLSLLIAKSIFLYNVIKYAGVLYLAYMGYKMIIGKSQFNTETANSNETPDTYKIYREGILTNLLNPKVGLFFIAFLPQFINPGTQNSMIPFLILGTTFVLTGLLWCIILVLLAASIAVKLKQNPAVAYLTNKVCGLTLVGMGIKIALTNK